MCVVATDIPHSESLPTGFAISRLGIAACHKHKADVAVKLLFHYWPAVSPQPGQSVCVNVVVDSSTVIVLSPSSNEWTALVKCGVTALSTLVTVKYVVLLLAAECGSLGVAVVLATVFQETNIVTSVACVSA